MEIFELVTMYGWDENLLVNNLPSRVFLSSECEISSLGLLNQTQTMNFKWEWSHSLVICCVLSGKWLYHKRYVLRDELLLKECLVQNILGKILVRFSRLKNYVPWISENSRCKHGWNCFSFAQKKKWHASVVDNLLWNCELYQKFRNIFLNWR